MFRQEGSQFVVLLAVMVGEDPPTDDAGMLAFANGLAGPEIAEVIRTSLPVDDPVKMRIDPPASLLSPGRVLRVFRSAGKAELSPVQPPISSTPNVSGDLPAN